MPLGAMTREDAGAAGGMPIGAMLDEAGDADGHGALAGPGADGMPVGAMDAPPAEPTARPEAGVAAALAAGLSIGGEWRLTLSSLSLGRDG
jgi:hypothetical protein